MKIHSSLDEIIGSLKKLKDVDPADCHNQDVVKQGGDPVRLQTTGLTSVDSSSHRVQIVIGKSACTAPFPFLAKLLVHVQTIKVAIMRHGPT